jgi:hypothetical protein
VSAMSSIYDNVYKDCGIDSTLDEWVSKEEDKKIFAVRGKKYTNQIVALYACVSAFWDYVVENHGTGFIKENYFELLEKHSKEIEDNIVSLSKKFKMVLNDYRNSYLSFTSEYGLDSVFLVEFEGFCSVVKPDLRYLRAYKQKKLYHVLNFAKILDLYEKEPNNPFFSTPEAKELINLINKPCLFLTLTLPSKLSPLETLLWYRKTWKNLYNNLRHLFAEFGLNFGYWVDGVELTKKHRLHVHILFLGVEFDCPERVVDFKKRLEHILNLNGWGFVNDVAYITNKYTYRVLLRSKLEELKQCRFASDVKVLKTFYLQYYDDFGNKKHALFHLVRFRYEHPSKYKDKYNSATKAINYILKYILKFSTYEDVLEKFNSCKTVEDLERVEKLLQRWLVYNTYFWLTGVRRFNMSRKLSSLLKKFVEFTYQKRFYFFNSEEELLEFLGKKDSGSDGFDWGVTRLWVRDFSEIVNMYPNTVLGLYVSLGLPAGEHLANIRFRDYIILDSSFMQGSALWVVFGSPPQ